MPDGAAVPVAEEEPPQLRVREQSEHRERGEHPSVSTRARGVGIGPRKVEKRTLRIGNDRKDASCIGVKFTRCRRDFTRGGVNDFTRWRCVDFTQGGGCLPPRWRIRMRCWLICIVWITVVCRHARGRASVIREHGGFQEVAVVSIVGARASRIDIARAGVCAAHTAGSHPHAARKPPSLCTVHRCANTHVVDA
jgi:hypothetical protein